MVEYIIFLQEQEALDLIQKINTCMGWPDGSTSTWMIEPDLMCEFDLATGYKQNIGYGVMIKDQIINCLSEEELSEVFTLPSNINTCSWVPQI